MSSKITDSVLFLPWKDPHLLTNQFTLLFKLINKLNEIAPPSKNESTTKLSDLLTRMSEPFTKNETIDHNWSNQLELAIINDINHKTKEVWLIIAKSYYPFFSLTAEEKKSIQLFEKNHQLKLSHFSTLSQLITYLYLTNLPKVNVKFQTHIETLAKSIAKITAIALSTPDLLSFAHKKDSTNHEDPSPALASSINPIDTIALYLSKLEVINKETLIIINQLLIQVKQVKNKFTEDFLLNQLEQLHKENKSLQAQVKKLQNDNFLLRTGHTDQVEKPSACERSMDNTNQLITHFIDKLSMLSHYRQNRVGQFFHIKAKHFDEKQKLVKSLEQLKNSGQYGYEEIATIIDSYFNYLHKNKSKRYLENLKSFFNLSDEKTITSSTIEDAASRFTIM